MSAVVFYVCESNIIVTVTLLLTLVTLPIDSKNEWVTLYSKRVDQSLTEDKMKVKANLFIQLKDTEEMRAGSKMPDSLCFLLNT